MQDTLHTKKKKGGALRLFIVGILTIATTLIVNLVVRRLAFAIWPISPVFLPLQVGPVSVFTVILVGGGVLVYAAVTRFAKRPARIYIVIALIALLLSLVPDALLFVNPDPSTFTGITRLAVTILIVLHLIDAMIAIILLTRLAPSKGLAAQKEIQ